MKNKILLFFLILINLIWIIFNGFMFHGYHEHFLEKELHVGECDYWSTNKEYKTYRIKNRWLIIKTIQDCKLTQHNKFLLESLYIDYRVPGNLLSVEKDNISASISGQAEIALNKIYNNKKTAEEWKRFLNENP